MPVVNRIADFADDMKEWRQWMHRHPELMFDCHQTAAFVVDRLKEFGITEIHEGIATSGVIAIIQGQGDGPTIGLRADMDALPVHETTGAPYASTVPGKMHACGHDGHTTMLLGAARYLAETRRFKGRVALIFQPAEEGGGGADVMIKEGVLEQFDISQVYALHNRPNLPAGAFQTRAGAIMAAADEFTFTLSGVGGHGAEPETAKDPVIAAVALVQAIQTISSRNAYFGDDLVISVTQIHAGTTNNVIPEGSWINGTVRTLDKKVQAMVVHRMEQIAAGVGAAYDVNIVLDYKYGYPATHNHAERTDFAIEVAREVAGDAGVILKEHSGMGAEDFSYMLEKRPGCYLYLGQGDGAPWHHPDFDFNDEVAPIGASFFARVVERASPL